MKKKNRIIFGWILIGFIGLGTYFAVNRYLTIKIMDPMINAIGSTNNEKKIAQALEDHFGKMQIPKVLQKPSQIVDNVPEVITEPDGLQKNEELEILQKLDIPYLLKLQEDGITDEERELVKKHIKERLTLLEFVQLREFIEKHAREKKK